MSHEIKFMQLTLKIDGTLCNVILSNDAKHLLLRFLPSLFDDGVIAVYKLPDDMKVVKYSELEHT